MSSIPAASSMTPRKRALKTSSRWLSTKSREAAKYCLSQAVWRSVTAKRSIRKFRRWTPCWEPTATTASSSRSKMCFAAAITDYAELTGIPKTDGGRIVTTGGYYEYLKIAEGCDKHCTYCIIPKLRGSYRSVPMEDLLEEARTMAAGGVRELVLVAQETTLYGTDLYGKPSLHLLLKELCKIPELYWIRILYCYPEDIYPELIQTMKEEKKICHYLDLPIQHANDEILRRMGRRTSKEELVQIITTLREEIPDITLRTTLITGFPGETKEQHEELLEFVNDMEFDRLGVFTYSPEEGTPAANMDHQIDEETKLDRQAELMELQQDISMELGERKIGQVLTVMIEGKVADENAYVGRSASDAPGVDGYVFVNTDEELVSGDFVKVTITGALEYDLIGEIVQ